MNGPNTPDIRVRLLAQDEANRQREGHHPDSILGSIGRKSGFIDGAVWAIDRVSLDEAALAIARQMRGWNEDTTEPDIPEGPLRDSAEAHWRRVNETCLQEGRRYAEAMFALLRGEEGRT